MFDSLLKRLVSVLEGLNIFLILPALVLLILSDIVLRSFFSSPIPWAHEVSGLLLICLFFLAVPKCVQEDQLLSVDLFYQRLPSSGRRILHILTSIFLLLFSVLLVWQGSIGVLDSLEYGDRAYSLNIPYWPFYLLMALVGVVTACQSLQRLFRLEVGSLQYADESSAEAVLVNDGEQ